MRVFVTGATGFVGSAVVRELLGAGHAVLGLARSDASAAALEAAGAKVQRGTLDDLDSLKRGAAEADGVIHTAFNHDFSQYAANAAEDARAIETMGAVLAGSARPMLVTSGLAMLATGRLATEEDRAPESFPRRSEAAAAASSSAGACVSVVRLAPTTHGQGDHGFVPFLIEIARQKGVAAYVEDGANCWAATHRVDAARLYRLALERGVGGETYHAVAEEGLSFRCIAEAIGAGLGLPAVSVTREQAAEHFGWMAMFAGAEIAASSTRTRDILGWRAEQPGFLEDLVNGGYFTR